MLSGRHQQKTEELGGTTYPLPASKFYPLKQTGSRRLVEDPPYILERVLNDTPYLVELLRPRLVLFTQPGGTTINQLMMRKPVLNKSLEIFTNINYPNLALFLFFYLYTASSVS